MRHPSRKKSSKTAKKKKFVSAAPFKDLPFYLSKMSIEYFLKYYYSERRSHTTSLSKYQIGRLKKGYEDVSVVLLGGLGGFLFGPQLECNLKQIVGCEVWSLGKGKKDLIYQESDGLWRCGSNEYHIARWNDEVAVVMRRLLQILKVSKTLRESRHVILIGHSSGGLINYSLGLLKSLGVNAFLREHRRHFPGVARIQHQRLTELKGFLKKCQLVAINTPFRGICQRLANLGGRFITPSVLETISENYLTQMVARPGRSPLDVLDLATHSEMAFRNSFKATQLMSQAIGSGLRFLSRMQQRGPNDGFVPKESAYLRSDLPHPLRDLDLGQRDHRDVIEHPEVVYDILKRLLELRQMRDVPVENHRLERKLSELELIKIDSVEGVTGAGDDELEPLDIPARSEASVVANASRIRLSQIAMTEKDLSTQSTAPVD